MDKPYYQDGLPTIYCRDCLEGMKGLSAESVDLLCTDPPYGLSFMGKDWDKAVPSIEIWEECLRVLKPGAFAFVMCIPRQDCLARMIVNLGDAGFETGFSSLYHAFASGFPKAGNISKMVDRKLGTERKVIGKPTHLHKGIAFNVERGYNPNDLLSPDEVMLTAPATLQAKALDGSYAGFQPKPAVEIILVCMKPLSEKAYVDQALKNQKGITWLDDGRMPYESETDRSMRHLGKPRRNDNIIYSKANTIINESSPSGRFPANLLVSDDVLDDGRTFKTNANPTKKEDYGQGKNLYSGYAKNPVEIIRQDSGSFSRYFSLDQWGQRTFPFLIVPKASKAEKNRGIGVAVPRTKRNSTPRKNGAENKSPNNHPTCKPLKLMSYLITLGSREGDTVLDPFVGSGTTCLAAKMLNRKSIGFETYEPYCEISAKRCEAAIPQMVFEC